MAKYILKESELRSLIKDVIAEELNESFGHALWNVAKNAALGAVAPGVLAQKAFVKTNNILNGPDTIVGTVKDFVGTNKANDKREKNMKSLENEQLVAKKYGYPRTVPRTFSNKEKLAPKVLFSDPSFGKFGRHYEDVDGVWSRKLEAARNNLASNPNLARRFRRQLEGWLEIRDDKYEELFK